MTGVMIILASIIHILCVLFSEAVCFARFLAANNWGLTNDIILLVMVLLLNSLDFFVINNKLNAVLHSDKPKCLLAACGLLAVGVMLYLIFIPNPVLKAALADCIFALLVQAMISFNCVWAIIKRKKADDKQQGEERILLSDKLSV